MAAEQIGRCRCPLCGGTARLSLAKSKLSCLTCNGCNCQLFARSDRSDEKLRELLIAEPPKAPEAPAPATPDPVRTAAPAPAPSPARVRTSWSPF